MRAPRRSIQAITTWVRRQPPKVKGFLAVVAGMSALVLLRAIVHDHDNLFVAAEAVHSIGISVLIYKLIKEKTCAGIPFSSFSCYLFIPFLLFHFFLFFGDNYSYPVAKIGAFLVNFG